MAASAVFATPALPAAAQDGGWQGEMTPYVWAAGLGGDVTPFSGAPTVEVDKSLSDVLDDLDGAFFLSGYARRDRFVLMGDLSIASVSEEGLVPPGIPARAQQHQNSLTLLGGYRAVELPQMHLDMLAGAHTWKIEGTADVFGGAISRSGDKTFTDPIVALRVNYTLSPRWSTIVYADYGGFDVGSRRTSQIVATANYQVTDQLYVSGGYRQLNVDYRKGRTRIDITTAGPLLGVMLRF